jgi:hypothetical protein
MRTAIIVLLLIMSSNLFASDDNFELHLGLKTYHVDRSPNEDGCLNESHDLIGIKYEYSIMGTYRNTHCRRSFYVGGSYQITDRWGVDATIVSGYPKKMHKIGSLVVFAFPTYTVGNDKAAVRFIVIPHILTGAGLIIKF